MLVILFLDGIERSLVQQSRSAFPFRDSPAMLLRRRASWTILCALQGLPEVLDQASDRLMVWSTREKTAHFPSGETVSPEVPPDNRWVKRAACSVFWVFRSSRSMEGCVANSARRRMRHLGYSASFTHRCRRGCG